MTYKKIMNLIPTIESVKLIDSNLKDFKKKKTAKNLLKSATKNIIGINLIQAEARIIGGL